MHEFLKLYNLTEIITYLNVKIKMVLTAIGQAPKYVYSICFIPLTF